jgi:hypothetical protein
MQNRNAGGPSSSWLVNSFEKQRPGRKPCYLIQKMAQRATEKKMTSTAVAFTEGAGGGVAPVESPDSFTMWDTGKCLNSLEKLCLFAVQTHLGSALQSAESRSRSLHTFSGGITRGVTWHHGLRPWCCESLLPFNWFNNDVRLTPLKVSLSLEEVRSEYGTTGLPWRSFNERIFRSSSCTVCTGITYRTGHIPHHLTPPVNTTAACRSGHLYNPCSRSGYTYAPCSDRMCNRGA